MVAARRNVMDDAALVGLTTQAKQAIVDSRLSGAQSQLAGVIIDSEMNALESTPADQREGRAEQLAAQERSLREQIAALQDLRRKLSD